MTRMSLNPTPHCHWIARCLLSLPYSRASGNLSASFVKQAVSVTRRVQSTQKLSTQDLGSKKLGGRNQRSLS